MNKMYDSTSIYSISFFSFFFIERSPRCNTLLPRVEVNRRMCIHHSGCPVSAYKEKIDMKGSILEKRLRKYNNMITIAVS